MLWLVVVSWGLLEAKEVRWTGAGSNNLWGTAENWEGGSVPTATEDALITKASVVLGQTQGGVAKSLHLSDGAALEIRGAPLTVGSLQLQQHASMRIDSGASTIEILEGGVGEINTGCTLEFRSGTLKGAWRVAGQLRGEAPKGGVLACVGGEVNITGSMIFPNATQLNWGCPVLNNGVITFTYIPSAYPFQINHFITTAGGKGRVEVEGGVVYFKEVSLDRITIGGQASIIINLGTCTLKGLTMSGSSTLRIQQSTAIIQDCQGQGEVMVGSMANVEFRGELEVDVLRCDGGECSFMTLSSGAHIRTLVVTGGIGACTISSENLSVGNVTLSKGTLTVQLQLTIVTLYVTTQGFILGKGIVRTSTALLHGFTRLDVTLTISNEATLIGGGALDGILNIQKGGTLIVPPMSAPTWGPSLATAPGSLEAEGHIKVQSNATLTINAVEFPKAGSYSLEGTLHLEHVEFIATSVTLNTVGAVLQAEGTDVQYSRLVGPVPGAVISLFTDRGYSTCRSPCPGMFQHFQTFKAVVQH